MNPFISDYPKSISTIENCWCKPLNAVPVSANVPNHYMCTCVHAFLCFLAYVRHTARMSTNVHTFNASFMILFLWQPIVSQQLLPSPLPPLPFRHGLVDGFQHTSLADA